MNIRFATTKEIDQWDDLLTNNPDGGNVFQSVEVANTKRMGGWKPLYIIHDELAITVIEKTVPLLGRYWYALKGPGVTSYDQLAAVLPELRQFASENGVFALKLDPEIIETETSRSDMEQLGLIRTRDIQANISTVIVDLSPDLDTVLASLNQKGRHAIRRAERDGVTARAVEWNEENARTMYDLLVSTAAGRFESSVRSYEYYRAFWQSFVEKDRGSLFFAYFDGKVVASAFCMYMGQKSTYKDGASVRERTAYGASHLLQWEVMKWMKDRGVTSHDLCGVPHSSKVSDPEVSFYGLGRFKTSFNKTVTDYVGTYDLPVKPTAYRVWQKIGYRVTLSLTYRLKGWQWF